MELKIVVVMLLVGFLSALYHAGKPRDSREPGSAWGARGAGSTARLDLPARRQPQPKHDPCRL